MDNNTQITENINNTQITENIINIQDQPRVSVSSVDPIRISSGTQTDITKKSIGIQTDPIKESFLKVYKLI